MVKILFDLGTTNLKYKIYKQKQIIEQKSIKNKELYFDENNFIYPNKLFDYFLNLINKVFLENKEIYVSFSSAMHTLILLDENNNPINPCFSLLDNFNSQITKKEIIENREINGLVNHKFLPIYKLKSKINKPIKSFTTLKSYLLLKFTNLNILEISDAAGTGLLDINSKKWSKLLLKKYKLLGLKMPQILLSNKTFKIILKNRKLYFNLGLSDGAISAIGSQLKKNEISLSIGTTLSLRVITNNKKEIDQFDYIYPIYDQKYIYGITSSNGGNNIEYILEKLDKDYSFINNFEMDKIKNLDIQAPCFFQERWQISKNEIDTKYTIINPTTLKSSIFELVDRVCKYKNLLENRLNKKDLLLKATGGIFQNQYIIQIFKNKFKDKITVFNDNSLIFVGLKKLFKKLELYNEKFNYQIK